MDEKDKQIVAMIDQAMQILGQAMQMMSTEDQGEAEQPAKAAKKGGSLLSKGM